MLPVHPDLAYTRRGTPGAPPLVLLHGIGHRRQAWDPILDELARDYDVIAPDLSGFGESPAFAGGVRYSMENACDHLRGQFAIALWDSHRERLLLTRDRVGVKPLFYHHRGSRIVFASEIKGIFASGLVEVTMDPQGLSDCLFYGHTIAPRTFWQGVDDLQS